MRGEVRHEARDGPPATPLADGLLGADAIAYDTVANQAAAPSGALELQPAAAAESAGAPAAVVTTRQPVAGRPQPQPQRLRGTRRRGSRRLGIRAEVKFDGRALCDGSVGRITEIKDDGKRRVTYVIIGRGPEDLRLTQHLGGQWERCSPGHTLRPAAINDDVHYADDEDQRGDWRKTKFS